MKKAIVLLILLAACKQTKTTNETTTTMTATESSATVATVAPTTAAPLPATSAIETMGTNPAAASSAPPPNAGAGVYKVKGCAVCHGASGAGDTPMGKAKNIPDFRSAAVQNKSDADLVKIIRDAPQHKAKGLSEEQAAAVVAWIRTLQ